MNNAILNKLQSVTNDDGVAIEFSQLDSSWQQKIKHSIAGDLESIYLVFPHSIETLGKVVKIAHKETWRIIPCGSGSKLDWGNLGKNVNLVVSTQKCDRIIEHAVNDLTVTVEAGIKLADLQARLKKTNQFLPINPAFPETATIGGILATADTGSLRQRYGGIRDLVLGISFIRGDGEIAKAGGRVVKNVAGYDLMKLLIGSYGTLGLISQVTFRTYPIPKASQTIVITGKDDDIIQSIQRLKNSGLTPTAADLIAASVAKKLAITDNTALIVRFQTIDASIQAQSSQLAAMLRDLAVKIITYQGETERDLWQQLTTLVRVPQTPESIICKLGILPTALAELLPQLATQDSSLMLHVGSGIGTIQIAERNIALIQNIRKLCNQNQGFLTILTAPQEIKQNIDIWGYEGNSLAMMRTIKEKFDPQQIFNCDRFIV